ncbi:hypothetical protein ACNEP6_24020 [Escherichia coli]
MSHQCAFYSEEGACLHEYATYSCESKTSGKVMVCGGDVFSFRWQNAIRLRAGSVRFCRSRFAAGRGTGRAGKDTAC